MKNDKVIHYTVAQLIECLKQFPQYLPVLVSGYEDGFENIIKPEKIKLEHQVNNQYWSGEFQEIEQQDVVDHAIEAIVLKRVVRDV